MKPYRVLILGLSATLLSCSVSYRAVVSDANIQDKEHIELIDERPEVQKERAHMSLNVMSCKYGSYQIGDSDIEPDRVLLLENALAEHLETAYFENPIRLKNYTIHINRAAQLRGQLKNMYGGGLLTNALIKEKVFGCSADDLFGGYLGGELETPYPPIVVVIDLEIDERIYHSRWLQNQLEDGIKPGNVETQIGSKEWSNLIKVAISGATSQLIENIISSKGIPSNG